MPEIQQITSEMAWKMLVDDEKTLLVDVRTRTEWQMIGIPDCSSIGRSARFVAWNDEQGVPNPYFLDQVTDGVDPDTPILLLCRSGARSNAAAALLIESGYSQAMNISGGFESPQDPEAGWKAKLPATTYNESL